MRRTVIACPTCEAATVERLAALRANERARRGLGGPGQIDLPATRAWARLTMRRLQDAIDAHARGEHVEGGG